MTEAELAALLLRVLLPSQAERACEPCWVVAGKWGPRAELYALCSHLDVHRHGWFTVGDLREACARERPA